MRRRARLLIALLGLPLAAAQAQAQPTLDIYYLDVDGGGGTLIVSPSGASLLIDAGWPGPRDAERILAAARQAGLEQIDYFLATHYRSDHLGAVAEVAAALPILNYVDHGDPVEEPRGSSAEAYQRYVETRAGGNHMPVRPGDTLHVESEVVSVRRFESKPDRGAVTMEHRTVNQDGAAVFSCECTHILQCRDGGGERQSPA